MTDVLMVLFGALAAMAVLQLVLWCMARRRVKKLLEAVRAIEQPSRLGGCSDKRASGEDAEK